jgi:uncharacterized protein (TIGR02145 family)
MSEEEVKIGSLIWMMKNLDVDHFRNGDLIPEVKDPNEWSVLKKGGWCYPLNDPENGKKYGRLYNWFAVNDPRGLAPEGWHISASWEFRTLLSAVHRDGNALKAIGQGDYMGCGDNTSGFSALLAGYRTCDGIFDKLHFGAYFWSSTEFNETVVEYLDISGHYDKADLYGGYKNDGLSIRCIKGRSYPSI